MKVLKGRTFLFKSPQFVWIYSTVISSNVSCGHWNHVAYKTTGSSWTYTVQTSSSFPNCFLCKPSPGFFLPQTSFPPSVKVPSLLPLASVCTWGAAALGWKSLYLHCLLVYNGSTHRKGHLTVVPSQDGAYIASQHFSPHETRLVNLSYQKGAVGCIWALPGGSQFHRAQNDIVLPSQPSRASSALLVTIGLHDFLLGSKDSSSSLHWSLSVKLSRSPANFLWV